MVVVEGGKRVERVEGRNGLLDKGGRVGIVDNIDWEFGYWVLGGLVCWWW